MLTKRPWLGPLRSAWESLRQSYWFIPSLMATGAAALALALLEVDRAEAAAWLRRLPWIQETGPEGTRAVLAAIAGSTITVTGVVFSITIVALTLASSQFGPRLLRSFLRDRRNQLVLGTFVATFLYTLLVLRAVEQDRIPQLATAVAVVLAVISVFVLIFFIHHASSSIQASSVIASLAREIEDQLSALFPRQGRDAEPGSDAAPGEAAFLAELARDGCDVEARACGYVRVLDLGALLALASEHDLTIRLSGRPGDFVQADETLARVGPAARADHEVREALRESFVLGDDRTAVQDLAFLTDQLAEIAVRALSPGVNDPSTAIACVHRVGRVAAALAERPLPDGRLCDAEGRLRVLARPTAFAEILASGIDPIRRYGAGDAALVAALLSHLAFATLRARDPERRRVLREHAHELQDAFHAAPAVTKRDVAAVETALARFAAAERQADARCA